MHPRTVTIIAPISAQRQALLTERLPSSRAVRKTAPNAPTATEKFNGGSTENITGAIYAPTGQVEYAGGASTTTGCTQIVALTVTFTRNASFGNSCTNSGISEPLLPPALAE
jgi:hypothetical protein